MYRRVATVLALVCAGVLLTGCSTIEGFAQDASGRGSSASDEPCVPSEAGSDRAPKQSGTPTPTPTPTLDPRVAEEIRTAVHLVDALRAVDSVSTSTSNAQSTAADTDRPDCLLVSNHFSTVVTVAMSPGASAADAAAVPTTMAEHIAWTGVRLTLTVPAGPGHIATVVHYDGTFDQTIPIETSTGVAQGLSVLAATPHVTSLEASIPMTMRVDYGSLTIGVDSSDQGTLDAVRAVIDTTAFRDTTLHGSFGNGAKP